MGDIVRIACASDFHFGKKDDPARLYNELKVGFIDVLKEFKPDIIELDGDLTDKKLPMNSEAVTWCNRFVDDVYQFTRGGTSVLLLHGTLSHDYLQINSYSHYQSDKFRIYKTASSDVVEGLRYLILPEESVPDPKKYYKELMTPKYPYDKGAGHGMFKHAGSYAHEQLDLKSKGVLWDAKDFEKIVRGIVSFGHIHTSMREGNVLYTGSFSRFNFGEEEPKGFYLIEYDRRTGESKVTFVENKLAPRYKDIEIIERDEKDVPKTIDRIRNFCKENDFVRVIPKLNADSPLYQTIMGLTRETQNLHLHNKFVVRTDKLVVREETVEQVEKRQKREMYKDLHFIPATIAYAKNEFGVDLTEKSIMDALIPLDK